MSRLCTDDMANNHEVLRWQSSIQSNFSWCAVQHIRYTTLIIPERHVIYADKLPSFFAISESRPLIRFLNSIDPATRAAILYPDTELLAARHTGEVFHKTDEHLNNHGNYTCYLALLDHIRKDYSVVPTPRWARPLRSADVCGNLGMMLDEEPTERREFWVPVQDPSVKHVFGSRRGRSRVEIFETSVATRPRAIIFGDSSLDELRHLLAPHFSRLVVVHHCHQFFYEFARSEQPDFVFHIFTELTLGRTNPGDAVDSPEGDFHAQCGEPLLQGPILLSINFAGDDGSRALSGPGWSVNEQTHTWMVGEESILMLPLETSQALASHSQLYIMTIGLWPMTWPPYGHVKQRLRISYGQPDSWNVLAEFEISVEMDLEVSLADLRCPADAVLYLRFEHPDGLPANFYTINDDRIVSLAIKRITISARQDVLPSPAPARMPPPRTR